MVRTLHYSTHEGMASNVVNTIMQDRQGYLWLGTNLGLTRFDGYRFVNFYHEVAGKRQIENVTGIVEDTAQNRLIVRGTDYYLYPFDLNSMSLLEADTSSAPKLYYSIKPDHADEPAIVRHAWERGVQCKNTARRHDAMRYVTLDNGNEVWTTIDNGFYIYDTKANLLEHFTSIDSRPAIASDLMSEILLDRSGTVWMTNFVSGLYQLQFADEDIRHHTLIQPSTLNPSTSDQANSIRSFSQLPDGRLLVSNMDGDVYRYDLDSNTCELVMHKEHRVYATLTDPQGRLWVGTRNGGVWVNGRNIKTTDSLAANVIFHFFHANDGTVWISTLDGGLIAARERFSPTEEEPHFSFTSFLKEEKVHQVDADAQGRLWVATESGVFVGNLSPRGKEHFNRVYEGAKVVSICCTTDGRVLAATIGNGLLIMKADNAQPFPSITESFFTTADGLCNDCVKAVAWDKHIGIVAATDAGITIIAPNGETRSIYSPEGIIADTYNESAALRLGDGRILLGSLNGFVEITPSVAGDSVIDTYPPVITAITINDEPRYAQHFTTLILPHNQNNISIAFSCLDFKNQPSIIYNYRLEGLDSDWRPSTKESTALYNNLSPGHYRFRLRAACAGHPWGEETVCDIHIRQPWWWTWWARLAYLLAILLFIWYEWQHYSERQRLRRQLDQRLTALYALEVENKRIKAESTIIDEAVPTAGAEKVKESIPESRTAMEQEVDRTKVKADDATIAANKLFFDKLDSLILTNLLQTNLDMAFLADKMCMSHSTLYRRIKSLTGMTANEYIRKHRLAKAMQLLRNGIPSNEVAMECGFNSPSYFTRCFKAEYGMVPSEV